MSEETDDLPATVTDAEVDNKSPKKLSAKDLRNTHRLAQVRRHMAKVANTITANPTLSFGEACKLVGLSKDQIYRLRKHGDYLQILRARVSQMRDTAISTAQRVSSEADGRTAILASRALWDMSNDIAPLQASDDAKESTGPVIVNVGVLVQRLSETTMGKALLEVGDDVRTSTVVDYRESSRLDAPTTPHKSDYEALPPDEAENDPGREILEELTCNQYQGAGGPDGQAGGGRDET